MTKIKTNFSTFSDIELIVKGASIITAMTDNAYFTAPLPPIADVKTALDEFAWLHNLSKDDKESVIIKNKARATVETFLSNLALYVQLESNGNEIMLQSSGFEVIRRYVMEY
jgi:hypothetical protein